MATDWAVSEFTPEPGFSPDGLPFPRRGKRLVRIQRELTFDYWESVDLEIPANTPASEELAVALSLME